MPKLTTKGLMVAMGGALAVLAASLPAAAQQGGAARGPMEQCVTTVLTKLYRSGAPETQVGPAIVSQCDRQLRATLEAAIKSGEAGGCTVETCIDMARGRAAEEATAAYRQQARR